jgi:YidC/Oxa1 family membrane protein insertase
LDPRTYYWNLLLVEPLMRGLRFLADDLGLGAAAAIIIFTVLIRVVLLPLTLQQIRSQKAMQKLQPEIKALQKKYGNDREKVSQETMALYKEHGVNPAASCLPMALQMPVLFALYAAMRNLGAGEGQPFHDPSFTAPAGWLVLNQPDIIKDILIGGSLVASLPFALPGILPVLAAITQWVQQRMMTPPTDDPQQKMQNQMMQFMPLMMLWFGLSFSSALALYWVTQNLFGIVQQYFSTGWGSLLPHRAGPSAGDGSAPPPASPASGSPGAGERRNGRDRRNGRAAGAGGTATGAGSSGTAGANGASGGSSGGAGGAGGGGRGRREGRRASGKR